MAEEAQLGFLRDLVSVRQIAGDGRTDLSGGHRLHRLDQLPELLDPVFVLPVCERAEMIAAIDSEPKPPGEVRPQEVLSRFWADSGLDRLDHGLQAPPLCFMSGR